VPTDGTYIRVGNRAERRARRRGRIDGWRGAKPANVSDLPPHIQQLVHEELATLGHLGVEVHTAVGTPNVHVDECLSRVRSLLRVLEDDRRAGAEAAAQAEADSSSDPSATSTKAQLHRKADGALARSRTTCGALEETRIDLARRLAERHAVVKPFRERAMEIDGIFRAQQAAYWGALRRFWRKKHGPRPEAITPEIELPSWITDDIRLFGRSAIDAEKEAGLFS
jgi:hypothetical protein